MGYYGLMCNKLKYILDTLRKIPNTSQIVHQQLHCSKPIKPLKTTQNHSKPLKKKHSKTQKHSNLPTSSLFPTCHELLLLDQPPAVLVNSFQTKPLSNTTRKRLTRTRNGHLKNSLSTSRTSTLTCRRKCYFL